MRDQLCVVAETNFNTNKNNRQDMSGVVQHLDSLAKELKINQKLPRFIFWKNNERYKAHSQNVELFKMYAAMSACQLQ